MRQITKLCCLTLVMAATCSTADEPKKPDNRLVGTWKLVSAKYNGKDVTFPEGETRLKQVTPTHFMWTVYDKDGVCGTSMGGTCSLSGNKYEEVPQFGTADIIKDFKGKTQSFEWKVEGNKWYHNGTLTIDIEVEEVWERVERK
jgi:hypothetical protein